MVIAGPGSGKTTVITNRITKLIGSGAAKPSEIMVITFTTAAADEMKSRFLKLNALTKTEVVFGTFHSVFLSFLKQYSNFQNLRLATQKESIALLRECVSHLYPDKNFTSDYFTHLLGEISRMKNGMYSSASLSVITKEYMREMSKAGLFDYDDMILLCLRMLKSDQKALSFIRASVKFILIDEFQDINRVQFEAVKLIAAPLNNLFVVGDDDQSIYAFRGSDPGIMLSFRQHFPQTKYIGLFTNYRSSPEIIGASLKLISHNRSRYFKKLNTANTHGPNITVWNFYDSEEEAEAVCRSILHYTRMDPERYKSFGILFRTHRAGNAVFREVELRKARDKALAQSA
ncbi:MAG: ATP-dependent helicase, partial [Eubacteriales bacterium]|nr:ATP-dependent helicase [Eubacteriales bacterium]